jgi:hypothetical protein
MLDEPDCRLLTLVGPGGVGKTRLALEAAARRIDRYQHGVHFVPLVGVPAPDLLAPAVAESLQFKFDNAHSAIPARDQLVDFLRERDTLLVLDNFEHLLDARDLLTQVIEQAHRGDRFDPTRDRDGHRRPRPLRPARFPAGRARPARDDNPVHVDARIGARGSALVTGGWDSSAVLLPCRAPNGATSYPTCNTTSSAPSSALALGSAKQRLPMPRVRRPLTPPNQRHVAERQAGCLLEPAERDFPDEREYVALACPWGAA